MKKYYIPALILALIIGAGYYAINDIAPYAIIQPAKSTLTNDGIHKPEKFGLVYDDYSIPVDSGINIKAWYIYAKKPSKITIIILHGIGASKEANLEHAKFLSENGINSILPDMRAHGESSGQYCTYGFYEKKDISKLIDFFRSKKDSNMIYGIWGSSLGGAIALQSLEYDKRIKFGIIESTFTSLKEIVRDYMKLFTGVRFEWVSDLALKQSEEIAKFSASQVKPEISATHIYQPVLYIHGTADERINFGYGKRIYKALKSHTKEFYPIRGAGHLNVEETGNDSLKNEIKQFIESIDFGAEEK
jgi:uncharacterized protein